ncbi:hypothetical protein ACTWQF_33855 [Streptomyces sp. 8N114]|uniref:hypothetical protein n=1 Tax=Streptomyces sp. 8N114 TaxID=3457419 RepID=UPI003FD26AD5
MTYGDGPEPQPQRPPAGTAPVEPVVGSAVRDPVRNRVGIVLGCKGPYLQLQPLTGGQVWDADPEAVQLLTHAELLSARVAEVNARSWRELGISGAPSGGTIPAPR